LGLAHESEWELAGAGSFTFMDIVNASVEYSGGFSAN
jgi:hypothetical protein